MLQIEKQQISLRFNDSEINQINPLLQEFQEKTGRPVLNLKSLLLDLLSNVNTQPVEIEKTVTVETIPENALVLHETKEDKAAFLLQLQNFRENMEIQDETSNSKVLEFALIKAQKTPENIPLEIAPNQVVVEFTPDQETIIDAIIRNRGARLSKLESRDEVLKTRFFMKDSLQNWTGEFYTGFTK